MSNTPSVGDSIPSAPQNATAPQQTSTNNSAPTPPAAFVSSAGSGEGANFEEELLKKSPIHEFAVVETPNKVPYRIGICLYNMGNLINDLGKPLSLKYNKDVTAFKISANIVSFGYQCIMQLALMDETANTIKSQLSDLMCVITIMQCTNNATSSEAEGGEKSLIYQPYVFMVESFEDGKPTNSIEKVYEMKLLDYNSYLLKNSSYGNLREKFPDIANSQTFTDVYKKTINFLTEKKASLFSGFKFTDIIEFAAADTGVIPDMVKMVLTPFFEENSRSLYDLLCTLQNKAVIVSKEPSDFSTTFNGEKSFSDPMSTLFLLEEFADLEGSYYALNGVAPENSQPPVQISYNLNGITGNGIYIPRKFFLRSLRSPFELAFHDTKCTLFEIINPQKDENGKLTDDDASIPKPILGYSDDVYKDCASHGMDGGLCSKHWQNVAVMYDANGGGNSYIIYFNWLYEYFNYSHLNFEKNIFASKLKKPFLMSVEPAYLAKQRNAANTVASLEDFTKYNAATIDAKTINREQESSFIIAEKLKACVLANECYTFDINGKMLRRLNEIIKVNTPKGDEPDVNTTVSKVPGGKNALANGFALLYIGGIDYSFNGPSFTNTIIGYNFARFSNSTDC